MYIFSTSSSCLQKYVLDTIISFPVRPPHFPFYSHILARLIRLFRFHLPTNHSHTSLVDKATRSAAHSATWWARMGQVKSRGRCRQREGRGRQMEIFYFAWNELALSRMHQWLLLLFMRTVASSYWNTLNCYFRAQLWLCSCHCQQIIIINLYIVGGTWNMPVVL